MLSRYEVIIVLFLLQIEINNIDQLKINKNKCKFIRIVKLNYKNMKKVIWLTIIATIAMLLASSCQKSIENSAISQRTPIDSFYSDDVLVINATPEGLEEFDHDPTDDEVISRIKQRKLKDYGPAGMGKIFPAREEKLVVLNISTANTSYARCNENTITFTTMHETVDGTLFSIKYKIDYPDWMDVDDRPYTPILDRNTVRILYYFVPIPYYKQGDYFLYASIENSGNDGWDCGYIKQREFASALFYDPGPTGDIMLREIRMHTIYFDPHMIDGNGATPISEYTVPDWAGYFDYGD